MFGRFQHWLARRGVRRRFAAVRVYGMEEVLEAAEGRALMLCPNHGNWWDGFVASCLVGEMSGRRFALVQEEKHLREYGWFWHAGVIGLDLSAAVRMRAGLRETSRVLADPCVAVVMFPEGVLVVDGEGPLRVKAGVEWLAGRVEGVAVVPVAMRYGFREGSRPEVWVRFGGVLEEVGGLQVAMEKEKQLLGCDWGMGGEGYESLWRVRRPVNEWWLELKRVVWRTKKSGR